MYRLFSYVYTYAENVGACIEPVQILKNQIVFVAQPNRELEDLFNSISANLNLESYEILGLPLPYRYIKNDIWGNI